MSVEAINGAQTAVPQKQEKKTGGAGKAWTSAFLPGVGQLCDGRTKAGLGYIGAMAGTGIAGFVLKNSIAKDCFEAVDTAARTSGAFDVSGYLKSLPKGKIYGAIALGLVSTGLWIANIVDAYKGNKNKS